MANPGIARRALLGLAVLLVAAACSGDDSGGRATAADPVANAPIAALDEGNDGVASGPITGLLTVQPSFGFGLFVIDPETGLSTSVPGVAAVESVDRNNDVIVSGGAAYTLGSKVREGQTFAADISVVKVDYATGVVTQLVALGFDRETDDSTDLISHSLVAVAGESVVVRSGVFGSDEGRYTVYDAQTGVQRSSFDDPTYDFETDNASCSGGITDLVGLSDGRLAGTALDAPALVDLDSGEISPTLPCGMPRPKLSAFATPAQTRDYAVFNEGPAPTDAQLARLLEADLDPEWGFIEGGGDLWWIDADVRVVDEIEATVGGVVQFDLASGQVEAVHPLRQHLAEYIDCSPGSDTCEISTIEQAQLRYLANGQLLIVDGRENGRVLTLTIATSDIRVTVFERPAGVDYTDVTLLAGDPSGVWFSVRRMTITKDDATGRSASGPVFVERMNPATGQIEFSVDGENLFFN